MKIPDDCVKRPADPATRRLYEAQKCALNRAILYGWTNKEQHIREHIAWLEAQFVELELPSKEELEAKLVSLGFKHEEYQLVIEFARFYHKRIEGCVEHPFGNIIK